jgi:Ser/Thr protein kinase RdoA (MazF antagonist)
MVTCTYSQLSADSAVNLLRAHYDLDGALTARFYVPGLHDNFLVESHHQRYILRVYRNEWRRPTEIHFELALLNFLRERQAPVASPLLTTEGGTSFRIACPEGERVAALFHYAEGIAPQERIEPAQSRLLGEAVADVHHMATPFVCNQERPTLDAKYLVENSIEAITPFLDGEATAYMEQLGRRLRRNWPEIPADAGAFGICIGDVSATNFHITDRGQITLFDFDQCGYGYRAFEIGKFASSLRSHKLKSELVDAFLIGYQKRRQLSRAEQQAIAYFELVSQVWVMAIYAMNVNRIGHKLLEKPFWDRRIAQVRELEAQQRVC